MARSKRSRAPCPSPIPTAPVPIPVLAISETQAQDHLSAADEVASHTRASVTIPATQNEGTQPPADVQAPPVTQSDGEDNDDQAEHFRRTASTWQSELTRLGWDKDVVCDVLEQYEMKCKKQFFLTCDLLPRPDRATLAQDVIVEIGYSINSQAAKDLVSRLMERSKYWKKNYTTRFLDLMIEHAKQCASNRIGLLRMTDNELQDFAATQFQTVSLLALFPHTRHVVDLEKIRVPVRPVTATAVDMRVFLKTLYVWSFFWTVRHCLGVAEHRTDHKRQMQAARAEVIEKTRALCREPRWNSFSMWDLPAVPKRRKTHKQARQAPIDVLALQADYRTFGDEDVAVD